MTQENSSNKTISRLAAVQAVYLFDISDTKIQDDTTNLELNIVDVISQHLPSKPEEKNEDSLSDQKINKNFMRKLVFLVYEHISGIDQTISKYLTKHDSIDKLSILLRAILRCAAAELLYSDTPYKVVIDEYTKLTKDFFGTPEVNFTNAILDKMAKIEK